MHDTFLNENLYEAIVNLCNEHSIARILNLTISVNTHSHISEESIREHFIDRNSSLIGHWTNIFVEKEEIEPLTATIELIDGENFNE